MCRSVHFKLNSIVFHTLRCPSVVACTGPSSILYVYTLSSIFSIGTQSTAYSPLILFMTSIDHLRRGRLLSIAPSQPHRVRFSAPPTHPQTHSTISVMSLSPGRQRPLFHECVVPVGDRFVWLWTFRRHGGSPLGNSPTSGSPHGGLPFPCLRCIIASWLSKDASPAVYFYYLLLSLLATFTRLFRVIFKRYVIQKTSNITMKSLSRRGSEVVACCMCSQRRKLPHVAS